MRAAGTPACLGRFFPTRPALFLLPGLTFVWSPHACVTYQQSRKRLSHCNYLQLFLGGGRGRPPLPPRRDRPANPLAFAKGRIRPHYSMFLRFLWSCGCFPLLADRMTRSSPAFGTCTPRAVLGDLPTVEIYRACVLCSTNCNILFEKDFFQSFCLLQYLFP